MQVAMIGCSAPYREAVEQRLFANEAARDHTSWDLADVGPSVVLIHCDSDDRWLELESHVASGAICVAVLAELDLEDYVKALAAGSSGVVQLDMPSAVTADVIMSAVQGEVVLPRHITQSLAAMAQRRQPRKDLDDAEIGLLRSLSIGATVVDLAAERFFSERTLRRHLQGVYLKLGARNRAEAIASACRAGLLD